MNVGVGTEAAQFLFLEYLFRIFGTVSLQCTFSVISVTPVLPTLSLPIYTYTVKKGFPVPSWDVTEWLPNLSAKPLNFSAFLSSPYRLPVCPHCKINPIYAFLFCELCGLSPNFHIHESVWDLYCIFPGLVHIFGGSKIDRQILEI